VLVLTPTGRDGELVCERLRAAGIECVVCADFEQLAASIAEQTGTLVIAQEALTEQHAQRLLAILDAQEPWSDLPVLLLTHPASKKRGHEYADLGLFGKANVTLVQRPLPLRLFSSSVRSALRARERQYRMRDLYLDLERTVQLSAMFVSILGHDLRTPLSAIRMSAETILRGSRETSALRPAGRILRSSDRMTRMIEQLLDLARVRQGGGIALTPRQVNLAELSQQVAQEIEDAYPEISIRLHEAGDLAGIWDPDRLAQVLTNLLSNAAQHGDSDEPIAISLDGAEPAAVRVRISNKGAVPADALPTLFEAFRRAAASSARTSERAGLGLGLFIAREIARAHGGDITASVDPSHTTFEVTLPREARAVGTQR
jgi:signal transduction histidine kinase